MFTRLTHLLTPTVGDFLIVVFLFFLVVVFVFFRIFLFFCFCYVEIDDHTIMLFRYHKSIYFFFVFTKITNRLRYLPLSTILPNKFLPRIKFLVEQFHLWFRNWYWHSYIAKFAPLAIADSNPTFSRTKRLCFLLSVLCTEESIKATPGDIGDKLLGSPAFAMPLKWNCEIFH